ncbi:DUF4476 domain-containing protein [Aurantibacillus circumpalustris]|uniref:DUF4476 domain-containing protein n=1 Tax=Aurantibacillus circumpalustris TaxID=3036359 RepID=UPI00295B97E7|nr:DUF4476 domain-containing protein [Aurantibacillus circumpalustris]
MRCKTLILFLFLICNYFSQNNLSLTSADGKVFRVFISNKAYNQTWQAHVLVEKITEDTLNIEVEYENKKRYPSTIYFLEHGTSIKNKEFNFQLESDGTKLKLRFAGTYAVSPLPSPLVPVKPVVDTSQKYRNAVLGHFCELKEGKPFYFDNVPKENSCQKAMPAENLNYVALLMTKAEVPDHKFTIVENVCRNNCLSIGQLSKLLNYIEYEIEKLKIVRLAYLHLVDLNNKKELEKNFRFEASIKELDTFFRNAEEKQTQVTKKCESSASQMLIDKYCEKLATFSNDAERFESLKRTYVDLCYSSNQITQVLSKFVHDREKLEVAKLLFQYCVDKDKFMLTKEVFSYGQSISELQDFVNKQSR